MPLALPAESWGQKGSCRKIGHTTAALTKQRLSGVKNPSLPQVYDADVP
jgi:hypothetical protein